MREIKFRAWDSFKKKMYYEPFTIRTCKSGVIELASPSYLQRWDELMQYTGLHDKNGKEIYDGDIVREECCSLDDPAYGCYGEEYEVLYDAPRTAAFILVSEEQTLYLLASLKYEVIGNIYENPGVVSG